MVIFVKQLIFIFWAFIPLLYLVYRVRNRNHRDLIIYCVMLAVYVAVYHDFIFGNYFVFHDTLWSHHVFYAIIDQWVKEGFKIGWNPFMNGGEPLSIYSNYFLWAEFFLLSILNKLFLLPVHKLVNLYFTYVFVSYFTLCFVLFSVIFKRSVVVFFAQSIIMFSGLTYSSFGQYVLSPLYLLPLIFLALYLFLTKNKLIYLAWSLFFLCISANHYLPHYLFFFMIVFLIFWYIFKLADSAPPKKQPFVFNIRKVLLIGVLSVMVLLPVMNTYLEIQDCISPTRGGELGEIKDFSSPSKKIQPGVYHSLERYKFLFDMPEVVSDVSSWENLSYNHSAYYLGYVAMAFFLFSFFVRGKNILHCSCIVSIVVLVYFSLGDKSWLWMFFVNHVPFFFLRHSYVFSHIICLLIIISAAYGFQRFTASSSFFIHRSLFFFDQILPYGRKISFKNIIKMSNIFSVIVVFITALLSIIAINHDAQYKNNPPFELAPFKYPVSRYAHLKSIMNIPFDTTPIITKKATAFHPADDFIFFRKKTYDETIKRDLILLCGNIFAFTRDISVPINSNKKLFEIENNSFEEWGIDENNFYLPKHFSDYGSSERIQYDNKWVRSGRKSLLLRPPVNDNQCFIRYTIKGKDIHELRGKNIRFSTWVLTDNNIPDTLAIDIHDGGDSPPVLSFYDGAGAWQKLEVVSYVGMDVNELHLTLSVNKGAIGNAYFDDMTLEYGPTQSTNELPFSYLVDDNPNYIKLKVSVPEDGYLIRKENFHKGWKSFVNNKEVPVLRFMDIFQAVPVSKGAAIVEFKFNTFYNIFLWLHILAVVTGYSMFFKDSFKDVLSKELKNEGS